ncbi:MAG: mechanosensitive ion channel family protein [bacterium]|nr:mechanosensitive ion channel family protein [bacterium]
MMPPDSLSAGAPIVQNIDYLKQLPHAAIIFAVVMGIGFLIKVVGFRWIARLASRSKTRLDDIIIGALRGPLPFWFAVLGLNLSTRSITLPHLAQVWIDRLSLVVIAFSITWAVARIIGEAINEYGRNVEGTMPVTSLTRNFAKIVIFIIGGLFALQALGISITPIITALGVGGLAVALALQDTLNNLFSGMYIMIAKQVRVGDYVKLDSGQEGFITDIGWRTTTIRSIANNNILVPNSKMAQIIITNFSMPERQLSLTMPISVSYSSDPDFIEKVVLEEVAKAAPEIEGLLADPPPVLRFNPGFGDSSLDFTLLINIEEFSNQFAVQSELRKRILKRFNAEGIEIPFPQRTLHLADDLITPKEKS